MARAPGSSAEQATSSLLGHTLKRGAIKSLFGLHGGKGGSSASSAAQKPYAPDLRRRGGDYGVGGAVGADGTLPPDVLRGRFRSCFKYWPRRWSIFIMLAVGNLLLAPLLSVSIVPMSQVLNMDNAFIGHLHSAFFYGFMATQALGGYLADRYGGFPFLLVGFFGMAICTLLTPTMAQFHWSFILSRVLMGFWEGFQVRTRRGLRTRTVAEIESVVARGVVVAMWLLGWCVVGGRGEEGTREAA